MRQGFDHVPALGLLAVLGNVSGAKGADALSVADRNPHAFGVHQVDQIGVDDDGRLGLGRRLGRLGRFALEQLGVAQDALLPALETVVA